MTGRPRTATGVRFDPEIHAALVAAAAERDLSVNFLVNLAVKELLPRLLPAAEIVWVRPLEQPGPNHDEVTR